ncbi:hypothetical protein AC579_9162 [Pseudocercospora musae]|uniref:Uncharacterized protein n=1 Tax=Pseudocercospora musae TaxID=113226 RepID=A0A139I6G6_9PEZI|nr:hypothetical protein AC579_9162 [Pseudocercospora musae]
MAIVHMSSMGLVSTLFAVVLTITLTNAATTPLSYASPPQRQCGEVNVFLHGLPPTHPLVIQQGYDPDAVRQALVADQHTILDAGYNYRAYLASRLRGIRWDAVGVGYGVRGSNSEILTRKLEEVISVFRQEAKEAMIVFNRSPNTTLEALRANVPLPGNCPKGKDLGFEV